MVRNYALAFYRTLARHRLYAALNVLGLALGVAVCTVLLLVVRFETSFDRWIPDAGNVYRVDLTEHYPGRAPKEQPATQPVLLPNLLAEFPQIRAGARLVDHQATVRQGPQTVYERVVFADPDIFRVFDLPFAAGAASTALGDTSSLVLTQSMARKYFGTDRALGRPLTLVIDGAPRNYRVTGVLKDLPPNTHLALDMMIRFSPDLMAEHPDWLNDWGSSFIFTYLRLRSPQDAMAIQTALPGFVDRRAADVGSPASKYLVYALRPLTGLHFADAHTSSAFKPGADPLFVAALGVMGLVTLLIAVVNYVSLATAHAGVRAREVALRQVMGATRRALIVQFMAESVAMALMATLIAAALIELSLPAVSAVLGEPIRLSYSGPDNIVPPLILLALLTGLASGVYPALVLSGFRPAGVLAAARAPGGGRGGARIREVLAVGQFAVAICLMVCTAVIYGQMEFVRHADLGFNRDDLVVVKVGQREVAKDKRVLLQTLRNLPGVVSATASDRRPATDSNFSTNVHLLSNPATEPTLMMEWISPDYMRTYGLRMLAGRPLGQQQSLDDARGRDTDQLPDGLNAMINASAARAFGLPHVADAVGQRMRLGKTTSGRDFVATIVGVVDDVRFQSPHVPPAPQFYLQNSWLGSRTDSSPWAIALRVPQDRQAQVLREVADVWRRMEPGTPLEAQTANAALEPFYDPEARRGQLFAVGAALACVIACLGLYGLAAFNTSRRV
ncbi:MAG TPA: ABC transporter permease, partial [Phenylobacterium sp.]